MIPSVRFVASCADRETKGEKKLNADSSFAAVLKTFLKQSGKTQKELAAASNVSDATVSRALRNNNSRKGGYIPSDIIVLKLALGLQLGPDVLSELFRAKYPELRVIDDALAKKKTVIDLNGELDDCGYSPL